MNFDLRKPLGAMFALLGAILAIYGVIADPAIYARSFDLNVNLIWGAVMLVFGGTMLWLGRNRGAPEPAPASVGAPREHLT
jgi:hypothetical protein